MDKLSFDIGGQHFEGNAAVGIVALASFSVLYGLRKFFEGGRCYLTKDLSGQTAVITGGNTGIGKETARKLVQLNCFVIIGSRDLSKNQQTVDELSKMEKGKIVSYELDLADKDSIGEFASRVKQELNGQALNYLVNNAGVMALPTRKTTKQGFEFQMGVNHLGHFYLTYELWDDLKKSGNPRIINVSSSAHAFTSTLNLDDLSYEKTKYGPWTSYSNSKKANIMFTKELSTRMKAAGMNNAVTVSLHPGAVRTELLRHFNQSFLSRVFTFVTYPIYLFTFKTAEQGAQTSIYAILQDADKLKSGQYYADCKLAKIKSEDAKNPEKIKKLWEVSEQAFGIQFKI